MKAARLHQIGKQLVVEETPLLQLGPDEVLVKVAACGLCHSDLSIIHGYFPASKMPIILGHEASGTVIETGEQMVTFDSR